MSTNRKEAKIYEWFIQQNLPSYATYWVLHRGHGIFSGTNLNRTTRQISAKIMSFFVFSNIVEYTKSQLLRSFANSQRITKNALIFLETIELKFFTVRHKTKIIWNNFHSIQIEIHDIHGALRPFISVGTVRLTLQKLSD